MTLRRKVIRFIVLLYCLQQGNALAQQTDFLVSQPVTYRNLSIFPIRTNHAQIGKNYITLDEAIQDKKASLLETGTTNLTIVNKSSEDIFIQAGEIVKGGQQDRMIASDLIIPSGPNQIPIPAYCVEHDRSTQRGTEPIAEFSSANELAPLPSMILAGKKELLIHANSLPDTKLGNGFTAPATKHDTAENTDQEIKSQLGWYLGQNAFQQTAEQKAWQQEVWDGVTTIQSRLANREGGSVQSTVSPSSLELTLESPVVQRAGDSILQMIMPFLHTDDETIGIVCAINGRIVSADLYGSASLFKQHLPELLRAAAFASLVDTTTLQALNIGAPDIIYFLAHPVVGAASEKDVTVREHLTSWQSADCDLFESEDRLAPEYFLHRSYIAK